MNLLSAMLPSLHEAIRSEGSFLQGGVCHRQIMRGHDCEGCARSLNADLLEVRSNQLRCPSSFGIVIQGGSHANKNSYSICAQSRIDSSCIRKSVACDSRSSM